MVRGVRAGIPKSVKMQVLFVDDVHLTQAVGLGCWVPNSSEASMPSPECNRMTRGGERDQEAAGSRIQIPPGRNVKDKLHTKKENKKWNSQENVTSTSNPPVWKPAAPLSATCHSSCWIKLQLGFAPCSYCTVQILIPLWPHHPQDT